MNELLAKEIILASKIDQETRFLPDPEPRIRKYLIYATDAVHSYRIRNWIKDYGYPTLESVGEEALHMFWLLAQHQDHDLVLMEDCLKNCHFAPQDEAFLTDRVCTVKGVPQIYGTQFKPVNGERTLYPVENMEKVDELRSQKGLEPLASYLEKSLKKS